MDVCDVKVTNEDGFLAGSESGSNRVATEIVFLPLHPDTGTLLHEERVVASSSTSQVSLMECGHPRNLLLKCFEGFPERGHTREEN